jgi:hypothetical protein
MPSLELAKARFGIIVLVVTALIGLFHFSRLTPIHGWSDDGSVYLQYARNLIEGRPYHFVLSGQALSVSSPPSRYPPVLPMVLIPIVHWRGLDFFACKVLMLALFIAASVVSIYALRIYFPPIVAIASGFCLLSSYAMWQQADHINSDFLLLLLCGLLFLLLERFGSEGESLRVAAAVVLILLATATRTAGAVLIPAVLIYSIWRHRRITKESWVVCVCAVVIMLGIEGILGSQAYSGQAKSLLNWTTFRRNLIQYPLAISELTGGGVVAAVILDLLFVIGAALSMRRGAQYWAAFGLVYGGALIFWPFSDPVRFLIPLWPWIIACILYALYVPLAATGKGQWVVCAAAGMFLFLQAPRYQADEAAGQKVGLNTREVESIYEYSRRSLPTGAVVAFRKPRTFSLLTGIRSIQYGTLPPERLGDDLCRSGATHIISAWNVFPDDAKYIRPFLDHHGAQLQQLVRTENYTLFRIPAEACALFVSP